VFVLAVALGAGCAPGPRSQAPAPAPPWPEDEFAARAAALQKTCELAAVYVGVDNGRALVLARQGREDALAAARRAPDAARGAPFVTAYERLGEVVAALEGVGDYAPPPSARECERLREGLTLAAEELKPLGEPYYAKLTRRYEGPPSRPRRWGPRAAEGPTAAIAPSRSSEPTPGPVPGEVVPAPATAEPPPP